ncbi:hypothetical protein CBM2609_A40125 [Cupriavidus taiwanensis]|nr:hypothetical protein CBM2604_A30205 [Cupriavidus taiwanensis]SOZ26780.1 hypothetical protein CBM2609_A40125 [Cupriavidus taiwanensis]SOZ59774.1 hypothetical protein CBM2615_A60016 [Cupriavidus taiwanensis]SOZ99421.1 hypothetical protein CBM2626_A30017 [Cupriavidus taiwanensis]
MGGLRGRHGAGRRCLQGLHERDLERRRQERAAGRRYREGGLRRRQGQHAGQEQDRFGAVQPRRVGGGGDGGSGARGAGQVRQGQAHDRRADALGLREPEPDQRPPAAARRYRPAAGDQDQLREPRGLGQGEDPAVGRQQVGGGIGLDRRQQEPDPPAVQGHRGSVREGEGDYAGLFEELMALDSRRFAPLSRSREREYTGSKLKVQRNIATPPRAAP